MSNAATRLYAVLRTIRAHVTEASALETWPSVLGVAEEGLATREHAVARRLALLQAQLATLRAALGDQAKQEEFAEHLDRVENALSLRHFGAHWPNVRNQVSDDTFKVFGVMGQLLPSDSGPAPDVFEGVLADVDRLVAAVSTADDLSPELRRFLLDQLGLVRTAVVEFAFGGVDAIRDAADLAAQRLVENADIIKDAGDQPLVHETLGLWMHVKKRAGKALTLGMVATWLLVDVPEAIERLTKVRDLLLPPTQREQHADSPSPALLPGKEPKLEVEVTEEDLESGAAQPIDGD